MTKKFNLKLPEIVKTIVDVYLKISPIKKGNTASSHLRPFVLEEVNKTLDYLSSERETNTELQKLLKKAENKVVVQALDSKLRF